MTIVSTRRRSLGESDHDIVTAVGTYKGRMMALRNSRYITVGQHARPDGSSPEFATLKQLMAWIDQQDAPAPAPPAPAPPAAAPTAPPPLDPATPGHPDYSPPADTAFDLPEPKTNMMPIFIAGGVGLLAALMLLLRKPQK